MSSFDEMDAFEGASLSQQAMARFSQEKRSYKKGLNPDQEKAVDKVEGPLLILAGAGTGKTRTLMARVAHLIEEHNVKAYEILAVTFTNKAAQEMRVRLEKTPYSVQEPVKWLGTFHSISAKLLRRHSELVDLKPNFTILDTDDQIRLIKQLLKVNNIDEKRWPPRHLAGVIEDWKNRALTPAKVPASDAGAFNDKGIELYAQYQTRLRELNAVDFGDLLLHMVTIFQSHPDVLAQYQHRFRYILVDEYQDTNVAQYLWLHLLSQKHKNICCVGDDDQSIYGWRGADVTNILRFKENFPGAEVVRLEQNYRSTRHILAAASNVIRGNESRLGKELWTDREEGEKVRLIGHWDGEEEARWIGEELDAMQVGTRGVRPMNLDEMAILVRASHQMRAFEDRFLTIGMPYKVIGGPRFYERMEIRDAMAYFRLVVSPEDDLAFERIVNTPKRGLGDKAQQTIQVVARENGVSLVEGARIVVEQGLIKGKGGKALRELIDGLARWNAMTRGPRIEVDDDTVIDDGVSPIRYGAPEHTHIELAQIVLDESGYTAHWQNEKTPEAPGRLENLKELVNQLDNFENLQGFLEHVSLVMDNEKETDGAKVSIMTLHAAKGLEFPAVFLPGWEDGLFPSQRSMDETGIKGLEEERRLAYVGITRAEEVCTISFAANRRVFGQWQNSMPSRFIDELPEEHVEVLTPPGLYGGGQPSAGIETRAAEANVYNSPGWKRLQARQGQYGMSQPRETRNTVIDATAVASFTLGERVFHKKFGYGAVEGIEGDKVEVAFDKAGTKKVVAQYLFPKDDVPF
ncbi:ATP-dependent helicase [Ruegeria faecimaris]|uniref:ATP-dependent helicase n=1 Tax=Ruegeria faecimaris TaxID=686389 RepID=UPI002491179C|nr:UvrD-helicase domain-containing protein [Ruegeria faecimaris]